MLILSNFEMAELTLMFLSINSSRLVINLFLNLDNFDRNIDLNRDNTDIISISLVLE